MKKIVKLRQVTVKIQEDTYNMIENIANKKNESISEVIRNLLTKSLSVEWFKENEDLQAKLIRQQMNIVIKPHIERLAALSSKTGHMAATATFLNLQALQDLIPDEKTRDLIETYQKARKKAVEYMRTKTEDWEDEFGNY